MFVTIVITAFSGNLFDGIWIGFPHEFSEELMIIAFPVKLKGGGGAPLRIVAFIPENSGPD